MAFQGTTGTIACCTCGVQIPPNPSNMCVGCIRARVDITEGIPKNLSINFCKTCDRYLNPPKVWVRAALESKELLVLCIKRIRGLNKVKLIDAAFIWTEPHSRRLKVKITIQKEVFNATILQQSFVCDFVVDTMQCESCCKVQSNDSWKACVQVRQRAEHRRTFLYLEQLILKHSAHIHTVNVKEVGEGIDFFYGHKSHGMKFVEFLHQMVPCRYKTSEMLVSADHNNNTQNFKYSFAVEIVPVCKDDLVCLPPALHRSLGGMGPIVLCKSVSNSLAIIDPTTLVMNIVSSEVYWRHPFRPLMTSKQLTEYVVLDTEPTRVVNGKFAMVDVECARVSDFGRNDVTVRARCHLGNVIQPGDHVMGYCVEHANFNSQDLEGHKKLNMPDVILVKKHYLKKQKKSKRRNWKLKKLDIQAMEEDKRRPDDKEVEEETFMQELEEDPEMRARIALYKDPHAAAVAAAAGRPRGMSESTDMSEDEEDQGPVVGLEELLEDLTMDGAPAGGGEGGEDSDEDVMMED